MKKAIIALGIGVCLLGMSGCKLYWKVKCTEGSPCEGEIGGTTELASKFRPLVGLLASTGVYTYEDWVGFDANDFEISIDETQSTTTIDNNQVLVKVLSSNVVIATKYFAVTKYSNKYKFSNPSAVKDWAHNFIDSADTVKVDFDVSSTGTEGASTTVGIAENGVTKASTTFTSVSSGPGGSGGGSTMIQ